MFSLIRCHSCLLNNQISRFSKTLLLHKINHLNNAAGHGNIRKYKLIKSLASTLLFGTTFIAVIWAKKHRKKEAFEEAKMVPLNPNYHKNFKLYEYKGFILPTFVLKNMNSIHNFGCREDDIFVVSFPKTGTTWLQEIIYCIVLGLDKVSKITTSIEDRFPYLEYIYPGISSIDKMHGQRFIKTHLPYSLLPEDIKKKKPKIFCIMRNPKDVAVSFYHFVRMMTITGYIGSFESFFQDVISNKIPYGPLWKHYAEIWENRNESNILILFYEDFHKDIKENIRKISEFLGKDLTEQEIDEIAHHCSFNNMSNNPSVNYQHWDDLGIRKKSEAKFFRKGQVGDWRNYFTDDMNQKMDLWINQNFQNYDISFTYDFSNGN